MIFNFGNAIADIDVERTRKYYSTNDSVNDCDCIGCKNYRAYIDNCDYKIKEIFSSMGIDDLKCITEIIPYDELKQDYEKLGGNLYGGFYHVCGKIIENESNNLEDTKVIITDKYEIYLVENIALVPNDFPQPVLQIEIFAHIPWVIEEENEYLV